MDRLDQVLQSILNVPAKMVAVDTIDASIHETETIGRTNDSIDPQVQNRPAMNGHKVQIAAVPFPRIRKCVFCRRQNDAHFGSRSRFSCRAGVVLTSP